MIVEVVREERYWYPDDGGQIWIAGFHLVGADGRLLGRDAPEVAARGLLVAGVAGAGRHHAAALADEEAVRPGATLDLRRDPGNAHDPNAVAVHHGGGARVGYVPRELAARVAPELDAGRRWSAVVLRERRASPRDPLDGLTMLLAPAERVQLLIKTDHPRSS